MVNIAVLLVVALLAALPVATAVAQDEQVFVITEEQINNSYAITNPIGRAVTDARVDIQDGHLLIAAQYRRAGRAAVDLSAVFTAGIENGHVVWTLRSATVNGEPASQEVIDGVTLGLRRALARSIRHQILNCLVDYDATSVTLANDAITITYVPV